MSTRVLPILSMVRRGRGPLASTYGRSHARPFTLVYRSLTLVLLLNACTPTVKESAHDFTKQIEREAYDNVAEMLSDYCDSVFDKSLWIQRTRIEARREIRQSTKGYRGPSPPTKEIHGLDTKTAEGNGPILRIWCEGEEVPDFIWEEMVRDWRD